MNLLVTGAAGFLGSHLCKLFLKNGFKVTGLDDLSTGSLRNIETIQKDTNFQFIEDDVRNPIVGKYDFILNFACPASPIHYQFDPVKTIETNFIGMKNVLHSAKENNSKVLQASTSEVYGDPTISPQHENYWGNVNPIGIRSCYDEGKRAAETLCFDFRRQYGIDVRVIRIFNTYGPNMAVNDGRVISNFIVQALKNDAITLYGNGKQTRSFCYVDDLVQAIFYMTESHANFTTPVNLGNPHEFTMIEIAEKIIVATGSNSKLTFSKLPMDDPKQRKPDITLAKQILGWEPSTSVDEGIARTIKYFEEILK